MVYPALQSNWNVMAHSDAREGKWRGKLANGVGSQYPSHYLGTWCIQNYSPTETWWHTVTHGRESEGGNWLMEWVASTLHTTSKHGVFSITRVQLKCDGTRWRTGGEVKGKLANGVGSQYSSHYIETGCIQHYSPVEMWWHTVTHGRGREGETGECSG